jgi:putative Mg2+ transporter-C (MgtC) family protein
MNADFPWGGMFNLGISWAELLIRIGVAILVGGAIGIEREYKNRPAGMRTHVLVCLGSATVAILECLLSADMVKNGIQSGSSLSLTRMSAQVISGIGFLGAGTIFMTQKKIAGLTTAASLWNVACLGLMIGFGYYIIGIILGVIILAVLSLFQRIIHVNVLKHVEVKYINRTETMGFINNYFEQNNIRILDIDFHIETFSNSTDIDKNMYTNLYTLHLPPNLSYTDIVTHLSEHNGVQTVRTRNT